MNSFVEPLESRSLLSAYPVIANDAAVIADNQHLTDDKTQLTADTASFKALVTADKTTLQTTVAQDRSAVKTDQAAVKADVNDPTLLAPAQATLENAMVKLSGDTASLKTRLSVDSANQKTTLGMDKLAMRLDQADLNIDTRAATLAFSIGVRRVATDVAAIEARGPASTAIVATVDADVIAAARGQAKPDPSAVLSFASALTTALNSGRLSSAQETTLAQDVIDVANSEGVPAGQTQGIISAAQALLTAGGATVQNTQSVVTALEGMIVS